MTPYCANGTSLSQPWVDRGFSHCFLATVAMVSMFGFLTLGGAVQLFMFWKYALKLQRKLRSPSCLYMMQLITSVAMVIESVIHVILESTFIGERTVYGYQILTVCISVPMWSFATVLLHLERRHVLRQLPSLGHGIVLVIFWSMAFIYENLSIASWASPHWWWAQRNPSERAQIGLWLTRYTCTMYLFLCGFHAPGLPNRKKTKELHTPVEFVDDEDPKIDLKLNGDAKEVSDGDDQVLPVKTERESTWSDLGYKVKFLFPYAWPRKDPMLQVVVTICAGLLVAGRVVNLFIPIYNKKIVDSLTTEGLIRATSGGNNTASITEEPRLAFRWDYILIYVFLRFLQGSGAGVTGLLNNLRNLLWISVQQYTVREVGVALVAHLHALSLRWHLSRKTGEVLRVMDRGTVSVNSLLSYFVFNILPTVVDICIAIVYFLTQFNVWFALIVFVTMALYLAFTVMVTEWRTKFRRQMNTRDDSRNAQSVDAILNYETVKYYGAEEYEVNRYRDHVLKFQRSEWIATAGLNMLNSLQNLIITLGFTAGALLCAWYVSEAREGMTVGDYVLFSSYILQLYTPLNQLGMFYRAIQQAFIDMENMFDLLHEDKEVEDAIDAKELEVSEGQIEFKDVSFSYLHSKQILKSITFTVLPGQTIALVGPSGSGKSTIIRLLFRFYDPQSGCILFDGQDITKVTQKSLRQATGVVPQDTCLFNDDIRFNVRYGRLDADDTEVEVAAAAADIHDRILTFPAGYDTAVGERGLKLSGGEKQRVAIARTILKAPRVVLLDEATSALDTQTERNIQASLAKVCENKTTVIVAHRLSTIIHAHQILVLQEGHIVERGTHEELLHEGGVYAGMWHQQLTSSEDTGPPPEGLRRRGEGAAGRGRGRGGGGGGKGGRNFDLDLDMD